MALPFLLKNDPISQPIIPSVEISPKLNSSRCNGADSIAQKLD